MLNGRKRSLGLLLVLMAVLSACRPGRATENTTTLNFVAAHNLPAVVDNLLYTALRRIGYNLTVESTGMSAATLMVSSGEKDGLAVFLEGLETLYPDMARVPEAIGRVKFEAYGLRGASRKIASWQDLAGLRVATPFSSPRVKQKFAPYAMALVEKTDFSSLVQAVEQGECDVFVYPNMRISDLPVPAGIEKAGTMDSGDVYPYLHVRQAEVALDLAESLRAMKEDGTFDKILRPDSEPFRNMKTVMIVTSYSSDDAWEEKLREGIIREFSRRGDVAWYFVSLNSNRILTATGRAESAIDSIRSSVMHSPPDIVVALGLNAVEFLGDHHYFLFNEIPAVLFAPGEKMEDMKWKFDGVETQIPIDVPATESALQILELFPNTRRIFVVNDCSETGEEWRRQTDRQLAAFKGRLEVLHNEELPFGDLLRTLQVLSEDTVVLFGHYNLDGNHFYYPQKDVQSRVSENAPVPVFGMRGDGIGYGQVGGKYVDPLRSGGAVAGVALSLLDIPDPSRRRLFGAVLPDELTSWLFDERVLKKWGISNFAHLPSDSVLINKTLSIYEMDPDMIIIFFVFFLLALIIVGVLGSSREALKKKNEALLKTQKNLHTAEELLSRDQEIREIKDRLEIALDASSARVWEVDFVDNTISLDPKIMQVLHLEPGRKLAFDEFFEILADRKVEFQDSKFIQKVLSGHADESDNAEVLTFTMKNGETRHCSRYFKALKGTDGKTTKVVGMILDITPRIKMEKELLAARDAAEAANRSKSRFLSSISHEIRTPMNAIIGMAGLLLSEALGEKQRKYANNIKISAVSLLAIINDILDISKMSAGKFELAPVDFDIGELLSAIESIFAFAAREKGIDFQLEIQKDLPRCLFGDDVRLRQILVNLIGNGIKFTEKGYVRLSVCACEGMLCFDVSDTGRGMKQEDLGRIFDSFEQVDQDGQHRVVGTGLGLFITKTLIELMEGSIDVESEYGRGSRFRVRIPLVPGEKVEHTGRESRSRFVAAPEARILVVDDNEINLDVATGMLRLHQIECEVACSGPEALSKMQNSQYDIIFMDHMMPDMDGVEAMAEIRRREQEDPEGKRSIVIALTANAIEGVRDKLLDAGMDDYLSKPIQEDLLNGILEKWLAKEKIVHEKIPEETSEMKLRRAQLLNRLSGLDELVPEAALERMGGAVEMYEKSLGVLMRRMPGVIRNLETHLARGDAKNFSIEVHGLKGALGNIGATEQAEEAGELERHSRDGDMDWCRAHTPSFVRGLIYLHRRLEILFAGEDRKNDGPKTPGSPEEIEKKLDEARGFLESFSAVEAADLVREMLAFDYGSEKNARLEELMDLLVEFEVEKALALIDSLD